MKIGFFAPHVGPGSSCDAVRRACAVADEHGADALWAVDHIAFPYGFRAVYPYATHEFGESPDAPLEWWDCLSVLSFLAARTERVRIGTGVLVLPYRHPVEMAEHKGRLQAMARDAGRSDDIPASILVLTHLTRDASVYPRLDAAHRRQAMTGTVEQVVDQLVAYRDAGVVEIHTAVGTDGTF